MSIGELQRQCSISLWSATPRNVALFFAGAAFVGGFIDPQARATFQKTEQKLQNWTGIYTNSLPIMSGISVVAALAGASCYLKSKEKWWLVGTGLMASMLPYTFVALMPINNELVKLNEEVRKGKKLTSEEQANVIQKISSWVKRHRVRVLISLLAAGAFYAAELHSTHDFSVTISRK